MKAKKILATVLFGVFLLTVSFNSQAQLNVNDPNIIWKDKNGKLFHKDSLKALLSSGAKFSLNQFMLPDGKMEIRIIPLEGKSTAIEGVNAENEGGMSVKDSKWRNALIGKEMPDFLLTDMKGVSVSKKSLKGKVTVFNFWFTTCSPCIKEMPALNQLIEKFQGKGVQFIAPSLNNKEIIKDFLKANSFKFRILPNAKKWVDEFGVTVFPTSIVVDKNGIISEVLIGYAGNLDELHFAIEQAIG